MQLQIKYQILRENRKGQLVESMDRLQDIILDDNIKPDTPEGLRSIRGLVFYCH